MRDGAFLNADTEKDFALFSYVFQFDGQELVYTYAHFSDYELQREELMIDGKLVFKCNFQEKEFDFENLEYVNAETANVERYLQSLSDEMETDEMTESRIPFLRWLISNVALENDSVLLRLSSYVKRMTMITANNIARRVPAIISSQFFDSLEKEEKLQDFQDFLNAMGIECRLELKKLPDGQKELYFVHGKLVPFFQNASSGTLALANLYCGVISRAWDASLLYLDEFDAFYHYEMAENVVKFLKRRYPKCQVIMTSHNTNLMSNRLMRLDCLFILSQAGKLTTLCNATLRELREGHNLEKMYISGEFEKYE